MYDIRVLIIDPDEYSRRRLKEQLNAVGHIVVADVADARKGLRAVFQTQPDLILISAHIGFEVIKVVEEHRMAPVLIISQPTAELLQEIKQAWVFGLVVPDMNEFMLESVIQIAITNFNKLRKLEEEVRSLKITLEERKIVERAKGLVMEKKGYSEQAAFQYLRKLSMDQCLPMVKVAKAVITSLQ